MKISETIKLNLNYYETNTLNNTYKYIIPS